MAVGDWRLAISHQLFAAEKVFEGVEVSVGFADRGVLFVGREERVQLLERLDPPLAVLAENQVQVMPQDRGVVPVFGLPGLVGDQQLADRQSGGPPVDAGPSGDPEDFVFGLSAA